MENFKKLFQGKKGKFFIAAFAIVAILGFLAWRRSRSTVNTAVVDGYTPLATTATTSGGSASAQTPDITRSDVVGMFSDYNTAVTDALKKQSDQNKSLSEAVNTSLAYQQSGFNSVFSGLQGSLGELTSKVNAGLLANANDKMQTATQSPTYSDSVTGYGGFNPPVPAVGVPSNVVPFPSIGLGKGGIDYNTASTADKKKIQDNEDRLQQDPGYRESERIRTDQVIKNRQAAGEDTTAQEAYKKKLG